jgi:hypothetical protein
LRSPAGTPDRLKATFWPISGLTGAQVMPARSSAKVHGGWIAGITVTIKAATNSANFE